MNFSEMGFGDRIKFLRTQMGFTLDDLAKKVGVSNATASRWETGVIESIRADKLLPLAEALGTSTAFLILASDDPDPSCLTFRLRKMEKLMEEKGISYYDMEKATGIPSAVLQRYVDGTTEKLPVDRMVKIASALKVPADYIFGDSGALAAPDATAEEHFKEMGLSYKDYLKKNSRLLSIPDEELRDEIEEADDNLLTAAHEICGMLYQDISHCIAAGSLREVWDARKVYVIAEFIRDNEKTLRVLINATDKKPPED